MGKSATRRREPDLGWRISRVVSRALIILAVAMTCSLGAFHATAATAMPARATLRQTPGRVIIKYSLDEPMAAARSAAADVGAQVVGRVRTFGLKVTGRYVVVSSETLSTGELVREYGADPAVQYVEPDYVVKADAAVTPNDPLYGGLWGMGQISAPLAWGTSTGSADVVVADIDSGVDYTHPDLAANMWHNPGEIPGNSIDDDGNGYIDDVYGINGITGNGDPSDDNGHGTHTSGTIAAVGDNGIGVTGVCWTARVMALKSQNSSGFGYTSDAITCVNYMTWEKVHFGVNVVAANASWAGGDYSQTLHDAIAAAGDAGIVFVCAAGNGDAYGVGINNDTSAVYPASFDCSNIIAVAASDSTDALAIFSDYGPTSVDLAAPGVGVRSAVPTWLDASGYEAWNGTSMATPLVTGAVALMAAAYPGESMTTRISTIRSSVDPVAALAGKVASGGRLDVANALYRGAPFAIVGFAPESGSQGTSVTVTGTGFTGATAVRFNGTPATTFAVDSATQITAAVPADATTGPITVTTSGGTTTSATSFSCTGTAGWFWQNPLPYAMSLECAFFADIHNGWVVGDAGLILATADGGAHWTPQDSGTTHNLRSVDFTDAAHGWAVGDAGTIMATTNGGGTWTARTTGITPAATLSAVVFTDAANGWAVGWAGFAGLIYGTTDGGAHWTLQNRGTTLRSVDFADASRGWAVGYNGTILATVDGGAHWTLQTSGTTDDLNAVDFTDSDHGWAVGAASGTILSTSDGGAHWTAQASGATDVLYSVHFTDATHGWVAGANTLDGGNGEILATSDGGGHWTVQTAHVANGLSSIAFADAAHGWAVNNGGTVIATADGGAHWRSQPPNSGTTNPLGSVFFINDYLGWAVGAQGAILATADGGAHWQPQVSGATEILTSVVFTDALHGWAVGGGGVIVATSDGGATWTVQSRDYHDYLYGVAFPDSVHGWAVGNHYDYDTHSYTSVILATADGGAHWAAQPSGAAAVSLSAVAFADASHGWAVGFQGAILATTDGGAHWVPQASGTSDLYSVAFVDATHGWAVGFQGAIIATTDGGAHWYPQASGTTDRLASVSFTDLGHGWVVSESQDGCSMLTTTDGGSRWVAHPIAAIGIRSVHFADLSHGWVVGSGGAILAYADSLDDTPPMTTSSAAAGWHNTPVTVALGAADDFRGSGMSGGAAKTEYKLDAGGWTRGTSISVPAPADHSGDGQHTLLYRSTDAEGNIEPARSAAVKIDTVPPTASINGISDGAWLSLNRWFVTTVTLTSTDNSGGSGVATLAYSLDGVARTIAATETRVAIQDPRGAHAITLQVIDTAGNASAEQHIAWRVDIDVPSTSARAASGSVGKAIALKYIVHDRMSPQATSVMITVKNAKHKVVRSFKIGTRRIGTWYAVKWTPKARGTYRYYVYAKDLAGNAQSPVGSAKITVR